MVVFFFLLIFEFEFRGVSPDRLSCTRQCKTLLKNRSRTCTAMTARHEPDTFADTNNVSEKKFSVTVLECLPGVTQARRSRSGRFISERTVTTWTRYFGRRFNIASRTGNTHAYTHVHTHKHTLVSRGPARRNAFAVFNSVAAETIKTNAPCPRGVYCYCYWRPALGSPFSDFD